MAKIDLLLQGFGLNADQGGIAYCGITLIQGAKNTLVDVGYLGRRNLLVTKLAERGLTPNDIDQVFLTHAHWDHILNVDVFPNAKILLHPAEREYIKSPKAHDWATPRYASLVLESQKLQDVTEGEEIDDGVFVMETPGHSRGSMAALVKSADVPSVICGDALADGWSAAHKLPRLVFWDVAQAKESVRKMLDAGVAFYPGHDRPFRVVDGDKIAYLQPQTVRVYGWPEAGVGEGPGGLTFSSDPPPGVIDMVNPPV